jgi:DNA repair exonuclease SbcCD ATPase subunit
MKLNSLHIQNWKNVTDAELTLAAVTIVRGANANGKTTIQQAIEYALTGRTDGTDGDGSGAKDFIRQGAEKGAVIEARLQANKEVTLRCSLTEKSGRTVTLKDDTDPTYDGSAVKGWLDKQKPVLSCLLNSRHFINLKPADQKTLLAGIILPDTYEWPEEIKAKCNAVHIAALIPWGSAPFDVIEKAHEVAFAKRRDVNRDLKNLHIPDAIEPPSGYGDVNAVRDRLAQLRQQVSQLERERSEARTARAKAEGNARVLDARIESMEAKLRLEQTALTGIESSVLNSKQLKDLQAIAGNDKKLAKLDKELAATREGLAAVNALLKQFDALDGKKACPTCSRDVTDEWLTAAMSPHIDAKNNLMNTENNLLRQQKEFGDIEGAKRRLEQHAEAEANQKRSRSIIQETDALLRQAKAEREGIVLPAPARADTSSESIDQEREAAKEISALEGALSQVAIADARKQEIARAKETQKKLIEAVHALESLVKYFGADGIKAQLLAEHVGPFASAINEAFAGWGYAVEFSIEPYGFTVTNLTRHTKHDIRLLSGSEKLRFAVAFQVALAKVSGIRMIVIDETDVFDMAARGAFGELLFSADLDQIIAIGTSEIEDVPAIEGAAFYAMREGKAVQLVAQEVA